MKTSRQLERYLKGVSNHWRIEILFLVEKEKDITLENIAAQIKGNFKTISHHTKCLAHAGLLNKKYEGTSVLHSVSPYGNKILNCLKLF